jgi:hypothetical protein
VSLQDDAQWAVLKPLAFAAIMDHYSSGEPIFSEEGAQGRSDTAINEDDDEVGMCRNYCEEYPRLGVGQVPVECWPSAQVQMQTVQPACHAAVPCWRHCTGHPAVLLFAAQMLAAVAP